MKPLQNLSDDEIDELILLLFNSTAKPLRLNKPKSIRELSDADLMRIRSHHHPDKSPKSDLKIYQEAVEELDRRRGNKKSSDAKHR